LPHENRIVALTTENVTAHGECGIKRKPGLGFAAKSDEG
jgi:hypothetical protein